MIVLILSISINIKWIPRLYNASTSPKFSVRILFNSLCTVTGLFSTICIWSKNFAIMGKAFLIKNAFSLPANLPMVIVLHFPYFLFYNNLILFYLWTYGDHLIKRLILFILYCIEMRTVIPIFFIAHQVSILRHIKKFIFDMIRISLPYLHIL